MTTTHQWAFVIRNLEHANVFDECANNWIDKVYKILSTDEIALIENRVSLIIDEPYNKTMTHYNEIFVLCFKTSLSLKRLSEVLKETLTKEEKDFLYKRTKNYTALYGESPFM